ncbi:hypothetical protein E2C01_009917 [Portunus trituberculatus]|uniref:Uncharacterized protein n=1 Tax=Portunus trituberculatus TaxID=210409 RepID=A0A5B7D6Z9_PORTR|nr:hypothetical protein [Portunus trituberculatus]
MRSGTEAGDLPVVSPRITFCQQVFPFHESLGTAVTHRLVSQNLYCFPLNKVLGATLPEGSGPGRVGEVQGQGNPVLGRPQRCGDETAAKFMREALFSPCFTSATSTRCSPGPRLLLAIIAWNVKWISDRLQTFVSVWYACIANLWLQTPLSVAVVLAHHLNHLSHTGCNGSAWLAFKCKLSSNVFFLNSATNSAPPCVCYSLHKTFLGDSGEVAVVWRQLTDITD